MYLHVSDKVGCGLYWTRYQCCTMLTGSFYISTRIKRYDEM